MVGLPLLLNWPDTKYSQLIHLCSSHSRALQVTGAQIIVDGHGARPPKTKPENIAYGQAQATQLLPFTPLWRSSSGLPTFW